mmetsp:Transcript_7788/g.22905  ORF Transcript_7788/g.22905 Transcript_7788/m.22905 type:complete len:205 (+) Transcript_7788:878-1492(+)
MMSDGTWTFVGQFGGEGTFSDAGGVRLDGGVHAANLGGGDSQSGQYTSDGGIGRGDVRIGTEIDIEHGGVGTLHQNLFPLDEIGIDIFYRIDRHIPHTSGDIAIVFQLGLHIDFQPRMTAHVMIGQGAETTLEKIEFLEIAHPQSVPGDFGSVRRPDPLLGRTDFVPSEARFEFAVDFLMKIEDEVSAVGYLDATLVVDALAGE